MSKTLVMSMVGVQTNYTKYTFWGEQNEIIFSSYRRHLKLIEEIDTRYKEIEKQATEVFELSEERFR